MELVTELLNVILVLSVVSLVGMVSCIFHQYVLHRRIDEAFDTLKEHHATFERHQKFQRDFLNTHEKAAKGNLELHQLSGKRIDALQKLVEALERRTRPEGVDGL
jgi:Tfp pilus assembly protein PilE